MKERGSETRHKASVKHHTYPFQHQLRNPVAALDGKIGVGVVEEQHLDLAAVVGVYDARARVDEVLASETRARSYPAV